MKQLTMIVAVSSALAAFAASAQDDKTIRVVVAFPPGAGVDLSVRKIAPLISKFLGQPVVVENRAGAGGNVAAQYVLRAPPDGLTLLYTAPATLVVNKHLYPKIGFDHSSFEPVSMTINYPFFVFTHAGSSFKTLEDLDAAVRKKPGGVSFASYGVGSAPHLLLASINSEAKTEFLHVPFSGAAPAITAVLGGQVDVTLSGYGALAENIKNGRLIPLAVTSAERDPLHPALPALKERYSNVPTVSNWFAFLAPPKTPPAVVQRFVQAVQSALKDENIRSDFARMYMTPVGSTSAELAAFMDKEAKAWGKVIQANRITAE